MHKPNQLKKVLLVEDSENDIEITLEALAESFDRMAGGDLDTSVPGAERVDEIGSIGKAVLRLRDSLQDSRRTRCDGSVGSMAWSSGEGTGSSMRRRLER